MHLISSSHRLGECIADACKSIRHVLAVALVGVAVQSAACATARAASPEASPVKSRNIGVSRAEANKKPRSEGDQAIVDGWPLYRSERGQTAFNDTMATLQATDGPSPSPSVFKACPALACHLVLPRLGGDGWLQPGRLWVSPSEYVLVSHSPRPNEGRSSSRRHSARGLKYFVFHEFHNSTRNTDTYDTISSHSGAVFVPFYMSKQKTDARGRRFVAVVQVAPYDVVSVHATNLGSAGPGIEVAKSADEELQPLQAKAGVIVAVILKAAAPQLDVVNHAGEEGLPMLQAYESRLAAIEDLPPGKRLTLPFTPAEPQRIASASGPLENLIRHPGASPPLAIAQRGILPGRSRNPQAADVAPPAPTLVRSATLR